MQVCVFFLCGFQYLFIIYVICTVEVCACIGVCVCLSCVSVFLLVFAHIPARGR